MTILASILIAMIICDVVAVIGLYVIVRGMYRELHNLRVRMNKVEQTAELARHTAYQARRDNN